MKRTKWYYYLYGIGVLTAFSFGLLAQQIVNNEIDTGLEQLYTLQNDYNVLNKDYDLLLTNKDSLLTDIDRLESEIKNKDVYIKSLLDEQEYLIEQSLNYVAEINNLKENIDQLEEDKETINNQVLSEQEKYQVIIDELNKENRELQKNSNTISNNVVMLSKSSTDKDARIERLTEQLLNVEPTIQTQQKRIGELEEVVSGLTSKNQELVFQIQGLNRDVSYWKNQHSKVSKESNYLQSILRVYHEYNAGENTYDTSYNTIQNIKADPYYAGISYFIRTEYGKLVRKTVN